ncbi:YibE/F family protein [Alkaliphilus serpentinus]|uniref:YibE/F family protein n=1 Tax=Alkaliphilus serpentinus TaxID=1482731 RepID=A0A833HLQ5_9FIRM|nr:YibE/F family protein [Alkaliphilus serpentinus]KAB3526240.1 YibE/F family protein [Alkaliphilus serpentinus]
MEKKSIIILLMIMIIFGFNVYYSYGEEVRQYEKYKAVITDIKERIENRSRIYTIEARFIDGPYENKTIDFNHLPIEGTSSDVSLRKEMTIIVSVQLLDDRIDSVSLYDVERRGVLKVLAVIFISLLIIFGGFKGIRAAVSLTLTLILILFCLVPLILKGFNPLLASILTASLAILINFILIGGFSRKSFCAIISTIGGTVIAGLFAYHFGNLMALTGVSEDTIQTFISYSNIKIDYRGLLFSGIIIGAIGAIMDVSMSIISFIFEMKDKYPTTTPQSLFKSGLNVGKDMMATMANTLILAYAGASLPIFLLFTTMEVSFIDAINLEFISEEILRSLCGSIGLISTIPLSSFIASIKAR